MIDDQESGCPISVANFNQISWLIIMNQQPGQILFALDVLGGCINNRSSWTGSYILTLVPE